MKENLGSGCTLLHQMPLTRTTKYYAPSPQHSPLKIMAISEDPHHTQKPFLYKAMVRLWKHADYSQFSVQFFPASANVLSVLQISQNYQLFSTSIILHCRFLNQEILIYDSKMSDEKVPVYVLLL